MGHHEIEIKETYRCKKGEYNDNHNCRKQEEYDEGVTVEQLIEKENVENPLYVTVTINDDFVDREKFGETVLKDGDAVEFLYFMGGGAR